MNKPGIEAAKYTLIQSKTAWFYIGGLVFIQN